jgi:hypothetical protein
MFRCVENDWSQCSSFSPAATLVLLILLGFESLLFGIFTLVNYKLFEISFLVLD